MTRPELCTEQHLTYLNELRESGRTNMFGATEFLREDSEEILTERDSKQILLYWMDTFAARKPTL